MILMQSLNQDTPYLYLSNRGIWSLFRACRRQMKALNVKAKSSSGEA